VGLEPAPSPIPSDGQTHSLRVSANAQDWVAAPRGLKAEEASIEANGHEVDMFGGLMDSPSVASGSTHELSSHAGPLSMLAVSQVVQLDAIFYFTSLDQSKTLPRHLEEGAVGFSELRQLDFGQRERVQGEAFSHGYQVQSGEYGLSDFRGERPPKVIFKSQFFLQLKQWSP
jgi:hypothetical protein